MSIYLTILQYYDYYYRGACYLCRYFHVFYVGKKEKEIVDTELNWTGFLLFVLMVTIIIR